MASGQWAVVLRHVQRLFHGGSVSGLTEGQLLDRFVSTRDEVAFGAILARHGPMVLGVCRGVLDDPHDVEDAFQATFLILVRKAKGLRDRDLLGQWLYGVARRVALRARADATKRKARERPQGEVEAERSTTLDTELRELQVLIREEVDRLSSNDRMAVVLCYLEGLTHEEAADRLGWPVGTVKGRLSRAREKLRDRLTRRGVALPAGALAANFGRGASASVPLELIRSTTLAATQLTSGKAFTAGIVSAQALTLMEGVIGTMFTTKLKLASMALVATCAVAVPGVLAVQSQGPGDEPGKTAARPGLKKSSEFPLAKGLALGKGFQPEPDPARDETIRLVEEGLKTVEQLAANARVEPGETYVWARRLVEAKTTPDVPDPERKAALQAYRDRLEKYLELAKKREESSRGTHLGVLEAQFHLLEADRWIRKDRVGDLGAANPMAMGGGLGGGGFAGRGGQGGMLLGPGGMGGGPLGGRDLLALSQSPADEKRNDAIRALLEQKIAMNFPNPTPFEDFKKYIESATQDEKAGFPAGLPIYVDPDGLKDVEATMASTITLNLEGIPLRTTLHLALRQLGLDYRVDGGLVLISEQGTILVQEMRANRFAPASKTGPPKP